MIYPFSLEEAAAMQQHDRVCSEILTWLATKQPDTSQLYDEQLHDLYNQFQQLQVINDILYIDMAVPGQSPELVVPLTMRESIISAAHSYLTGHYKTQPTLNRIRQSFY